MSGEPQASQAVATAAQVKPRFAHIRPYEPRDRHAVRAICCRTAFRNLGAQTLINDDELFADYWSRYYTDFESQSLFVAEQEGQVVGYLFGCVNSRRFIRVMARRIVPIVVLHLLGKIILGRFRNAGSNRSTLKWFFLKSWREAPPLPVEDFPAHYHCNLLPEAYQQNLYTRLALHFLDYLEAHGVTMIHGQLLEPKAGGVHHRILEKYSAAHPQWIRFVSEKPTDFGREVVGVETEFVNRAYGFTVADYRLFLQWMAKRYRL